MGLDALLFEELHQYKADHKACARDIEHREKEVFDVPPEYSASERARSNRESKVERITRGPRRLDLLAVPSLGVRMTGCVFHG